MSAISRTSRRNPRLIAFTCGDPAGIGPAAVLEALRRGALPKRIAPLLVGESAVWRRAGWRAGWRSDGALLRDTGLGLRPPRPGGPSAAGGNISAASFEEALRLAARGLVAGIVTAPVSKTSWALAGYAWRDHTERLSALGGAEMVLGIPSRNLWCSLATRHIPIKEAPRRADGRAVSAAARALHQALIRLGRPRPRLALCGLNPHAGEGGLIGREELKLGAALADLRQEGLAIEGPLPADSAWRLHVKGVFDGVVCLYHDQALIPLKVLGGLAGVNWTVGLPFPRTSPAHGTAWDAALAGKIDPAATYEAARLAARLVS